MFLWQRTKLPRDPQRLGSDDFWKANEMFLDPQRFERYVSEVRISGGKKGKKDKQKEKEKQEKKAAKEAAKEAKAQAKAEAEEKITKQPKYIFRKLLFELCFPPETVEVFVSFLCFCSQSRRKEKGSQGKGKSQTISIVARCRQQIRRFVETQTKAGRGQCRFARHAKRGAHQSQTWIRTCQTPRSFLFATERNRTQETKSKAQTVFDRRSKTTCGSRGIIFPLYIHHAQDRLVNKPFKSELRFAAAYLTST